MNLDLGQEHLEAQYCLNLQTLCGQLQSDFLGLKKACSDESSSAPAAQMSAAGSRKPAMLLLLVWLGCFRGVLLKKTELLKLWSFHVVLLIRRGEIVAKSL